MRIQEIILFLVSCKSRPIPVENKKRDKRDFNLTVTCLPDGRQVRDS